MLPGIDHSVNARQWIFQVEIHTAYFKIIFLSLRYFRKWSLMTDSIILHRTLVQLTG